MKSNTMNLASIIESLSLMKITFPANKFRRLIYLS